MKHAPEGLSVTRGTLRVGYLTAILAGACLFAAGFTLSTWITALIRSYPIAP